MWLTTGSGCSVFVLSTFLLLTRSATAIQVCVEGFVMDLYCINRGVLFDNPSVVTLEAPESHSVHCLVDVERCVSSGYNILLPNPGGSPKYGRALELDDLGNEMVVELARSHGDSASCTTCSSISNLTQGFRATFFGEIVNGSDVPLLLKVENITVSPRLYNHSAVDDGCPGNTTLNFTLSTDSGRNQKASLAHGSLMIIGWGFLLPTGIAAAHFLKYLPNALWFKLHRIIQTCGLIVAFTGWVVALVSFDDIFSVQDISFVHGTLGMIVMVIGLMQPFNALIRPHPPGEGQSRSFKRLFWEIVHKSCGYIAVLLAAVTILLGTFVIFGYNTIFMAVWGVSLVWLVIFIAVAVWNRYQRKNYESDGGGETEGSDGL